jgi:hypothetical protein
MNDMRIFVAALLVVAMTASNAFATSQYPDKIIYEGKKYDLHTNPMESYFKEHPQKRPSGNGINTKLWRRYVATFEVINNSLVLNDIEIRAYDGENGSEWKSVKSDLVPKGQALKIDWFTGIMVLPYGKLVNYVHMGYGSTYENYVLLEMKNGKLTGERKLNYKQYNQFKEKQFDTFKKTEKYRKLVAVPEKENLTQESIDSLIKNFDADYTSKFLDKEESPNKATNK